MMTKQKKPIHTFKILLKEIERQYGKTNFDVFADELYYLIRQTYQSDDFKINYEFEDTHVNSHFHTLNCEVIGIDSVTAGLAENELIKQRLIMPIARKANNDNFRQQNPSKRQ